MKKLLSFVLFTILTMTVFSQGYTGVSLTNKGIAAEIGYVTHTIDIGVGFRYSGGDTYRMNSVTIGKRFTFYSGENEDDEENFNTSITPSVGYTYHKFKSETTKNESNRSMVFDSTFSAPIFKLQIEKSIANAHRVKLFTSINYIQTAYYVLGIRFYFIKK